MQKISSFSKNKIKDNSMFWVLLFTFLFYVISNLPFIYSIIFVHKRTGLVGLWGYAPQQFLFNLVFFPFAAFSTFVSIHILISKLGPNLPSTFSLKNHLIHWPAFILIGLSIVSIITVVVYFSSAMSLDKLKPQYAKKAISSLETLKDKIENVEEDKREVFSNKLIKDARKNLKELKIPSTDNIKDVDNWLSSLSPEIYMQVVQNPSFQLKLNLLHPSLHSMSIFNILSGLIVAFCTILAAVICIYTANELKFDGNNVPYLSEALRAVFYAIFFFAIYPICYRQYRIEMESYVGSGFTILQDIFTGILVIVLLIWIKSLDPVNRQLSVATLFRYLPVLLVGSGSFASIASPQIMRELIGSETKIGIQIVFSLLFMMFACLPVFQLWPKK